MGIVSSYRSTSGSISWSSRLQKTVALSTSEEEYHSLSTAAQECCHLRNSLEDMGVGQNCPVAIHVDNQACIAISKNPVQQNKMKHISISTTFRQGSHERKQLSP